MPSKTSAAKSKPSKPDASAKRKSKSTPVIEPQSTSPAKGKGKAKAKASPPPEENPVVDDDEDDEVGDVSDEESDSDDDGVDEEGMARLMKALGEDGLNDFDRAQLDSLAGDSDEDEDGDEEGEEGSDGEDVSGEEDGSGDEESEEEEDAGSRDDQDEEEGEDEEEEEVVALDEVDGVLDEDIVPKQKIEIDDAVALKRIRETIQLDPSMPWTETLVMTYPHTIDVDVNDDLNRELAFYKQALHSANAAREMAAKHNFPFTRPSDYFAEMVKSDAHMERIRQRLLNESASIKKSEDKRKEREGKKFGKQVQIEKLKEREQAKKEIEERLKGLKRKRKDILDKAEGGDEDFDVAVEDALADRPSKKTRGGSGKAIPRSARDQKFGFGGSKRRAKQNTQESTDDFGGGRGGRGRGGGFGSRGRGGGSGSRGRGGRGGGSRGAKVGGGNKRPGKSKRMAGKSKQ